MSVAKSPGTSKCAPDICYADPGHVPGALDAVASILLIALPVMQTQGDSDSDSETKPW
jgi:hypothetical protein